MTATRRMIRQLREQAHIRINSELEALILEQYGTEADDCPEYTEQDLHEQIRKLIIRYNRTHNAMAPNAPEGGMP
jgi:hypothetical protein